MKGRVALGLALVAGVASAWLLDVRVVAGDDMAPSLLAGDVVVVDRYAPEPGDVVLLADPSDPDRTALRRVIATSGQGGVLSGADLEIGGQDVRRREMERTEARVVTNEADRYLVQHLPRVHSEGDLAFEVPADHVFVLADDRDRALDSRWWGPVSNDAVRGRVLVRIGSSDAWRSAVTWRSIDGPWIPPSKQPMD